MEALLALAFSALIVGAYVCRLDLMHPRTHRLVAVVLYYAGFAAPVVIGTWAAFGHAPQWYGWLLLLVSAALLVHRRREWAQRRTPAWTRKG